MERWEQTAGADTVPFQLKYIGCSCHLHIKVSLSRLLAPQMDRKLECLEIIGNYEGHTNGPIGIHY